MLHLQVLVTAVVGRHPLNKGDSAPLCQSQIEFLFHLSTKALAEDDQLVSDLN